MSELSKESILLSPIDLTAKLRLKNRIVVPPMVQLRGLATPEGLAWYKRLAESSAGLVICEATGVTTLGTDVTLTQLSDLADVIHAAGAAAAIQLFPVPFGVTPPAVNDLGADEIAGIIAGFARAAELCAEAGFDAIEPHGAHGYLLNQFFMPDVNDRNDAYGGSLDGRCRLLVDIVDAVKQRLGDALAVLVRHTPIGKQYGIEDSLVLAEKLVAAGCDVLDISPGRGDGDLAEYAAPFKASARFDVPVITVGGMEDLAAAEAAVAAGRCDMVAVGRQMIADPEFITKTLDGRADQIAWCTKCNVRCFGAIKKKQPVGCVLWDSQTL